MPIILPGTKENIKVFELSCDSVSEERQIADCKESKKQTLKVPIKPKNGDYIVCTYKDEKWVGFVLYDKNFEDYNIKFLQPSGYSNYYYCPQINDMRHISNNNFHGVNKGLSSLIVGRNCCDPFKRHMKNITTGLNFLTKEQ
ncbi:hypothetical protein Avbf_02269, partial [Armadillidium vulgare]